MSQRTLSEQEVQEGLANLKGWYLQEGKLWLEIELKDFQAAVELINAIAQAAASLDHHPDIHLENYNQLRVSLTTHSAGGITQRDIELAKRITALYEGSVSD